MSDLNTHLGAGVTHEVNERNPLLIGLGYSLVVGLVGYGISYLAHSACLYWDIVGFQTICSLAAAATTSVIISFMSFGIYEKKNLWLDLKAILVNGTITSLVYFYLQNI